MDDVIEDSRALHLSGDESCSDSDVVSESVSSKMSQAVKRKNEDSESRDLSQLSKRQALVIDHLNFPQDATSGLPEASNSHVDSENTSGAPLEPETTALQSHLSSHGSSSYSGSPSSQIPLADNIHSPSRTSGDPPSSPDSNSVSAQNKLCSPSQKLSDKPTSPILLPLPSRPSIVPDSSLAVDIELSAHDLVKDFDSEVESDPTYVLFRMYCSVKGAALAVGKKGETIRHLRETANARINVSDNLKGTPERIITVQGSAENVARAFGLLIRAILGEPENEPALANSKQYNLKLLIPHAMIGFIIGKLGVKFREIEEKSAAKLKAAEKPLPYLTERILSIVGVADAIHIATYYVAQVILEHKGNLKKAKLVLYDPQSYSPTTVSYAMMNVAGNSGPTLLGQAPLSKHDGYYSQPASMHRVVKSPADHPIPYTQMRYGQHNDSSGYDVIPTYGPSHIIPNPNNESAGPEYQTCADKYNNTMVGDVIVVAPIPTSPDSDRYHQDIFIQAANIGSVIGKHGNNIKHVREHSGCIFIRIEQENTQSLMLGGGKGMTPVRKLTLTGTMNSLQYAIYLINRRLRTDKERKNS